MPNKYSRIPGPIRFWRHVALTGPVPSHCPELGECWLWTGCTERKGYGKFHWGGHLTAAHRVSYEMVFGPVPDGLWVLHHCDNRLCCNPDHLFLGTAADNTADMVRKGRNARGERSGMRLHPESICRGERHGMARLTEAAVLEIRHLVADGAAQRAVAAQFGMSPATVCVIVARKVWKHV